MGQEDLSAEEVLKAAKRSKQQELENKFLAAWVEQFPMLPEPVRQYKFCPTRKWPFDFAWVDAKLAAEIQGGAHMPRSGHNTAIGQWKDYEKWREAVLMGWRILPFNTIDMQHPNDVVEFVARVLCDMKDLETG